jgi:translation initiation factor eIF-2B subunit delta
MLSSGKQLLTTLSRFSIPCTYLHLTALPSYLATTPITTVFLGAHSLHSNGAVFSRAGTALVSMMAREKGIPVVVCCETYKFSEGVVLDGFMRNELGVLASVVTAIMLMLDVHSAGAANLRAKS